MTNEVQESLFTMFRSVTKHLSTLDENRQKNTSGPGLGLTYCKNMIESLGGLIWFNSVKDKGSTFYLRFPVREATEEEVLNEKIAEKSTESILIEKLSRLQQRADTLTHKRRYNPQSKAFDLEDQSIE